MICERTFVLYNNNWETKGDKAKSFQPSIQTRHGTQGETRGDKAKSSQHSTQTCHGRERATKERQSKVTPAQHPDTPKETWGDKGRQSKVSLSPASRHADGRRGETKGDKAKSSQPSIQTRHRRQGRQRAGIILAQHRFYARIEPPHSKTVWGIQIVIAS